MTKATEKIDWTAVREAQKRSKYGRASADDQSLCELAWRADRVRYKQQEYEVFDEVYEEVTLGGTPPKRGGKAS